MSKRDFRPGDKPGAAQSASDGLRRASVMGAVVTVALGLLPLLAGCGGGGDSEQSGAATVNVAAGIRNLMSANQTWTATGKGSDGREYELALQSTPGPTGTYPPTGQTGMTSVHRTTVRVGGNTVPYTAINYFDATGVLFGVRFEDGLCETFDPQKTPPPSASAIGGGGLLATSTEYATCAAPSVAAEATATSLYAWAVQRDAGLTLMCVEVRSTASGGVYRGTQQTCIETTPDGTLGSRVRFYLDLQGVVQVVAKNY